MKILIIRFSSIGDIVLTTPVIRCLKKQVPHAQVHYLTKKSFEPVLAANPYIDKRFFLEGDLIPVIMELLRERYDVIIDLHHNLRTRYVKSILTQAFNSNIRKYSVNKLNLRKWLLTTFKLNLLPDKSIVERYFETVKPLGVTNDGQGLDYFIPQSDELKNDDLPTAHTHGFVACVIGGAHETKKMPVAQWKAFCSNIEFPVVLLGGKEDAANGEAIRLDDPIKIYNACGKFSLNESAHIVSKARLVVTHDTGLMHIAAAFKKPIVSIWGNTVPSFGMFPYFGYNNLKSNVAPQSVLLENRKLSCRPCSKIGYAKCPKGHFRCMTSITTDSLMNATASLLSRGQAPQAT